MPKQNFSKGDRYNWKMFHIYTEQHSFYSVAKAPVFVIFVPEVGARQHLYHYFIFYLDVVMLILLSSQVSTLLLIFKVMFMQIQKFRNKKGLHFHLYCYYIEQMRNNITMIFSPKIIKLTGNIKIRIQLSLQVELLIFLITFLAQ